MFETKFNRNHAVVLRQHGFSASEISEFLQCSSSWLYNVVKEKPNAQKKQSLMQYVVDNLK